MVNFTDIIPLLEWGLFAAGAILIVAFISKIVRAVRRLLERRQDVFDDYRRNAEVEQASEGSFWYVAEILHAFIVIVIFIVAYDIIAYLLNPNLLDVTIYSLILGTWTIPLILLIVFYYILKMVPYWLTIREYQGS